MVISKKGRFNSKNLSVYNHHHKFKSPISKKNICELVKKVIIREKGHFSGLSVNLVTDKDIKKINRKFLNHNYSTDVITFLYNKDKRYIDSEIFISLDTVKKNGEVYKSGYIKEFKRVLIHGCLHIAGYKDKTGSERELITTKENYYLI